LLYFFLVDLGEELIKFGKIKSAIKFEPLLSLIIGSKATDNSVNVLASRITYPALEVILCEVHRHFLLVVLAERSMVKMLVFDSARRAKNVVDDFDFFVHVVPRYL
jgi:transposase-like protein